MPDTASLSAIVYAAHRVGILTEVTLRVLLAKNIDMLRPCYQAKICLSRKFSSYAHLKSAFESCYRQVLAGQCVRLSVVECKALLAIIDAALSWQHAEYDQEGSLMSLYYEDSRGSPLVCQHCEAYWWPPLAHHHEERNTTHVLLLRDQSLANRPQPEYGRTVHFATYGEGWELVAI